MLLFLLLLLKVHLLNYCTWVSFWFIILNFIQYSSTLHVILRGNIALFTSVKDLRTSFYISSTYICSTAFLTWKTSAKKKRVWKWREKKRKKTHLCMWCLTANKLSKAFAAKLTSLYWVSVVLQQLLLIQSTLWVILSLQSCSSCKNCGAACPKAPHLTNIKLYSSLFHLTGMRWNAVYTVLLNK